MSKPRSPAWTPEEAKKVITSWRRSGLSAEEYSRRNGVGRDRLYRWARLLPAESADDALIPVKILEHSSADDAIEIRVGDAAVFIRGGFDPATLEQLLKVLRG